MSDPFEPFAGPDEVCRRFDDLDYLVDEGMATAVYLAVSLGLPLLLEGEPGVGKTTAAKVLATALDAPLFRLQCYEGLGANEALYEWNHQRQMLAIRLAESRAEPLGEADLFTPEFLDERPLLASLRATGPVPPVLLIDEIDRADDEFEALLLEFLGEAAVTVPEVGTIAAERPPVVVLTSNRSRELHDALRRRCLYHWIEFPDPDRVATIVRRRVPGAEVSLVDAAAAFSGRMRDLDLDKLPGLAETIDWVRALSALGVGDLTPASARRALGTLIKTPDDHAMVAMALDADAGALLGKGERR